MSYDQKSETVDSVETTPTGNYAINAKNLKKVYHLYEAPSDRLKQLMLSRWKQYYREFTAVHDISFELKQGEVLGVIGRNGAGKSTLLQLICGTLTPTSGELVINGRIAALLELGAGFNPEFTGRENIYLSASIMGVNQSQIEAKVEDIIEFSGVRPFIDQPVKTYSSGMFVRLAFSVATSVDPDILIIDEALSVGDGDFARRSFERIMQMRDSGKTILFCSHSLYQVESLCTKVIWLDKGTVQAEGEPDIVVPQYQNYLDRMANPDGPQVAVTTKTSLTTEPESLIAEESYAAPTLEADQPSLQDTSTEATEEHARLTLVTGFSDGHQGKTLAIKSRESDLTIDVEFKTTLTNEIPVVALTILSDGGHFVTSSGCWAAGVTPEVDDYGIGRVRVTYDKIGLLKGTYHVGILLFDERGIFLHDEVERALTLEVTQTGRERGLVYLPHYWQSSYETASKPAISEQKQHSSWQAVDANDVSQNRLLALFEEVFEHKIDPLVWRWKYRFAETPGSAIIQNNELVAFTGGIPRNGLVFGNPETLVQMGDVMVAKKMRGVLSKKGPFFSLLEHYLVPKVGRGMQYSLAFGFPNRRHLKAGVKRGLYNEVDKIMEVRWQPIARPATPLMFEPVNLKNSARLNLLDELWQDMQADTRSLAICVRDRDWIKHRYLDKPNADYLLYFVYEAEEEMETPLPIGLIVLRKHDNAGMELLDMVGSREASEYLVQAAQKITADNQCQQLFAWMTPSAIEWLEESPAEILETEVVIPGCQINSPEHALRVRGKWWIMGGDSDFR